jgi:hypothetical protein
MLISSLKRGTFSLVYVGTDVAGKQDMCHPVLTYLLVRLVGSTCPHGIL